MRRAARVAVVAAALPLGGCEFFKAILQAIGEAAAAPDYAGRVAYVTPAGRLKAARVTVDGTALPEGELADLSVHPFSPGAEDELPVVIREISIAPDAGAVVSLVRAEDTAVVADADLPRIHGLDGSSSGLSGDSLLLWNTLLSICPVDALLADYAAAQGLPDPAQGLTIDDVAYAFSKFGTSYTAIAWGADGTLHLDVATVFVAAVEPGMGGPFDVVEVPENVLGEVAPVAYRLSFADPLAGGTPACSTDLSPVPVPPSKQAVAVSPDAAGAEDPSVPLTVGGTEAVFVLDPAAPLEPAGAVLADGAFPAGFE